MTIDMPFAVIILSVCATVIAAIIQWTPNKNNTADKNGHYGTKYVTTREFDTFTKLIGERIDTLATKDDVQGLRDLIHDIS